MGLENIIAEALPEVLTTQLDALINWARKSSLWPATFGLVRLRIRLFHLTFSPGNLLTQISNLRFEISEFRSDISKRSPLFMSRRNCIRPRLRYLAFA